MKLNRVRFDPWLTIVIIMLMGTGMLMVFSASSIKSLEVTKYETMYFFVKKQALNNFLGLFAGAVVALFPYKKLRKHIFSLNIASIVFLVLIMTPLGVEVNGAVRWLNFGFQFQPSEFAKVVIIITMAHFLSLYRHWGLINKPSSLIKMGSYLLFYGALIGIPQNHASVVMVILLVAGTMLVIAGLSKVILAVGVVGGGAVAAFIILTSEFRRERVSTFLNPMEDKLGEGFQIFQNWLALGSGDFWGLGLGMSRQKFGWLPESHTDFILSIIGEELGYKGVLMVIGLFALLTIRLVVLALQVEDPFGILLVVGVGTWIFYQASINMAVISGLFPVTGMPLPFISYGGTSTIMFCVGIGIVYSVISERTKDLPKSEE